MLAYLEYDISNCKHRLTTSYKRQGIVFIPKYVDRNQIQRTEWLCKFCALLSLCICQMHARYVTLLISYIKRSTLCKVHPSTFFFSLYQLPFVGTPWIFHVFLAWESLILFFIFSWQIAFSSLYTVNLFLSYVMSNLYLTFIYSLIKIFSYLLKIWEII